MVSLRAIPWIRRERRAHERTKVAIPCRVVVGTDVLVGNTKDISLGGVCLLTPLYPDVAQRILKRRAAVALLLPAGEIEVTCTIVRVEEEAIAVKFSGLASSGHEEALREFLRTQLGQLI